MSNVRSIAPAPLLADAMTTDATLRLELARLQTENDALRARNARASAASIGVWVSTATGTINLTGFGNFPKSYHVGQISRQLDWFATEAGKKIVELDREAVRVGNGDKAEASKRLVALAMQAGITVRAPHAPTNGRG